MKSAVANDEVLEASIKSFIEIGSSRNLLVHQDYGNFYLEKTIDEIYAAYKLAARFVELVPDALRKCGNGAPFPTAGGSSLAGR
jgi:hypothetical protein